MAIAARPKPKGVHHKKRTAAHHRQTKHYVKSYWPYLPMVAVLAIGLAVNSVLGRAVTVLGEQTNLTQISLLDATNEDRQENKRDLLTLNRQLQEAAQAKANDMVAEDYWSHTSPNGEKPWKFITATGFQYQTAGENLAYGFDSADNITNAWMHSTAHRANMLDHTYTNVGFGVAQSGNFLGKGPETIVVAMYASPVDGEVAPANTTLPVETETVSRLESIAAPAFSGLLVGIVGTLAVVTVLVRHSIAWRKLLNRGELFVLHHPLVDTVLIGIAVTAVILSTTTGFIH